MFRGATAGRLVGAPVATCCMVDTVCGTSNATAVAAVDEDEPEDEPLQTEAILLSVRAACCGGGGGGLLLANSVGGGCGWDEAAAEEECCLHVLTIIGDEVMKHEVACTGAAATGTEVATPLEDVNRSELDTGTLGDTLSSHFDLQST